MLQQWFHVSPAVYQYALLPLLIFMARICDVSLGTIRVIFITRGMRYWAPLIGFFEVLIWLTVIGQIMQNLTNVTAYLAYAAGFATGNYVGISLEDRLAIGVALIRIITHHHDTGLIEALKRSGCGLTLMDAREDGHEVQVIFTVVKRKDVNEISDIIKRLNPAAVYTVEDVRTVSPRIFKRRPLAS